MSTSTVDANAFQTQTDAQPRRHRVDPKSKEFVHELMRCFNQGRQIAIAEYHAAQTAGRKVS
jgi:hypothetical protein